MHGGAAPGGVEGNGDRDALGIDAILTDFRAWLTDLAARGEPAPAPTPTVDLFTLVSQFTALRHEVNMQTKAVRGAVEQNAELVKQLAAVPPPDSGNELRPVAKALIDIADALSLSMKQMERFGETADALLAAPAESPGFFGKLFGGKPAPPRDFTKLKQLAASAADGYALSLRRVERVLPELQLDAIRCDGDAFDPETMEAIEVVGDTGHPSGTVIETLRPGYLWRGKVFRFAQVKVAR